MCRTVRGGELNYSWGDNMSTVFSLVDRRGSFSIDSANELARILKQATEKHSQKVSKLIAKLESMSAAEKFETHEIEAKINLEIQIWNTKVRKLGAIPKGLWLADIDSGDGFYCWKFPETEINYWHEYRSGYANRIGLTERAKKEAGVVALETSNA